jgi:DNA-binding GntR family transcriptional regulator
MRKPAAAEAQSRPTSQERAYRHIKDAILDMAFVPGTALRSEALAAGIAVSRTPVREALGRLEQEGLVERTDGWGYVVKAMSLKEALDLYHVREALEVEAVREAIPHLTAERQRELRATLKAAALKVRQRRLNEFRDNTRRFYRLIVEATDNAYLSHMYRMLDDRVRMLGAMMARHHVERPVESLAENQAVLAALEAADAEAAEAAVRRHVSQARDTLVKHVMRGRELPAAPVAPPARRGR